MDPTIGVSEGFLADVDRYVTGLQAESVTAAEKAVAFLHERVVARARSDPQWEPLADSISVWADDGRLVIGIKDDQLLSQAFDIEYGTESTPPNSLFRTMDPEIRAAGDVMRDHMLSIYGQPIT